MPALSCGAYPIHLVSQFIRMTAPFLPRTAWQCVAASLVECADENLRREVAVEHPFDSLADVQRVEQLQVWEAFDENDTGGPARLELFVWRRGMYGVAKRATDFRWIERLVHDLSDGVSATAALYPAA